MPKITQPYLRERRIFNAWDYAQALEGNGVPYISYQPATTGFGSIAARWHVVRPGFKTDPDAWHFDFNNKAFTVMGRDQKQAQLEAAMKWAGDRYGITEWLKTPFGSYMSADYVRRFNEKYATTTTPKKEG